LPGDAIERRVGTEPHSGLTLEYVRAGEGELTCAGRTCHLQPGTVYLLHPKQPHMYRAINCGVFEKHYVIFWKGATEGVIERLGLRAHTVVTLGYDERETVEDMFAELTQLGAGFDATTVRRRSALCYELLLVVADAASGLLTPEPFPERLDRAVQFAMTHLGDQLSVPKLAEAAGCSPAHVTRLFEKHLGLGAHQWLERTRMTKAAYCLQHTRDPVYRVAEQFGYQDPYYFSAAFKRVTGMSPTQWRKRQRG
jgi:AraC-like DNA-binding protein